MTDHPVLCLRGIAKRYGTHVVLDGVDLEVAPGEAVALLGPNGTGKSTLIGCVCGAVIPDAGQILIDGVDLRTDPVVARRRLRYLPQEVDVPEGLTGHEILEFYADVFGDRQDLPKAEALASLGPALTLLASTYSVGMRKRLMFAGLLPGEGRLYVLDEPFAGVDGESRERLIAWLKRRQAAGAGLLLAAHDQDREALEALGARNFDLTRTAGSGNEEVRP